MPRSPRTGTKVGGNLFGPLLFSRTLQDALLQLSPPSVSFSTSPEMHLFFVGFHLSPGLGFVLKESD